MHLPSKEDITSKQYWNKANLTLDSFRLHTNNDHIITHIGVSVFNNDTSHEITIVYERLEEWDTNLDHWVLVNEYRELDRIESKRG